MPREGPVAWQCLAACAYRAALSLQPQDKLQPQDTVQHFALLTSRAGDRSCGSPCLSGPRPRMAAPGIISADRTAVLATTTTWATNTGRLVGSPPPSIWMTPVAKKHM
jgi:hypothetical protein